MKHLVSYQFLLLSVFSIFEGRARTQDFAHIKRISLVILNVAVALLCDSIHQLIVRLSLHLGHLTGRIYSNIYCMFRIKSQSIDLPSHGDTAAERTPRSERSTRDSHYLYCPEILYLVDRIDVGYQTCKH